LLAPFFIFLLLALYNIATFVGEKIPHFFSFIYLKISVAAKSHYNNAIHQPEV